MYGKKKDKGKLRLDLIPVHALHEYARVLTYGTQNHDERNWERGMKWSRLYAAAQRHLTTFWSGKDIDDGPEGSGLTHLAGAIFSIGALIHYYFEQTGEDDRVKLAPYSPSGPLTGALEEKPQVKLLGDGHGNEFEVRPGGIVNKTNPELERKIYLALPYSGSRRLMQLRYEYASFYTAYLVERGNAVYSPICQTHNAASYAGNKTNFSFWEHNDTEMLKSCTEVIVLCLRGHNTSVGVRAERNKAEEHKIPVFQVTPSRYLKVSGKTFLEHYRDNMINVKGYAVANQIGAQNAYYMLGIEV
jgi:hypothetical protein